MSNVRTEPVAFWNLQINDMPEDLVNRVGPHARDPRLALERVGLRIRFPEGIKDSTARAAPIGRH